MVRWRTGCEGRISCAKRDFGLNRTRIDGLAGARTWCGHGIFAHNLVKISGLIELIEATPRSSSSDRDRPTRDQRPDAETGRQPPRSTEFFRSK